MYTSEDDANGLTMEYLCPGQVLPFPAHDRLLDNLPGAFYGG